MKGISLGIKTILIILLLLFLLLLSIFFVFQIREGMIGYLKQYIFS